MIDLVIKRLTPSFGGIQHNQLIVSHLAIIAGVEEWSVAIECLNNVSEYDRSSESVTNPRRWGGHCPDPPPHITGNDGLGLSLKMEVVRMMM